jgi:hypothetical protein
MKNLKFISVTIFILFFGFAFIEALQKKNWVNAGVFIILGIISVWADLKIRNRKD